MQDCSIRVLVYVACLLQFAVPYDISYILLYYRQIISIRAAVFGLRRTLRNLHVIQIANTYVFIAPDSWALLLRSNYFIFDTAALLMCSVRYGVRRRTENGTGLDARLVISARLPPLTLAMSVQGTADKKAHLLV